MCNFHSMVSQTNPISIRKGWQCLMNWHSEFIANIVNVMLQLKKLGKEDPRRAIHSFKVAFAITLVSSFYYFNSLYHSFGSSAMWAVMTVIVVSEFSVGKFCFFLSNNISKFLTLNKDYFKGTKKNIQQVI